MTRIQLGESNMIIQELDEIKKLLETSDNTTYFTMISSNENRVIHINNTTLINRIKDVLTERCVELEATFNAL